MLARFLISQYISSNYEHICRLHDTLSIQRKRRQLLRPAIQPAMPKGRAIHIRFLYHLKFNLRVWKTRTVYPPLMSAPSCRWITTLKDLIEAGIVADRQIDHLAANYLLPHTCLRCVRGNIAFLQKIFHIGVCESS